VSACQVWTVAARSARHGAVGGGGVGRLLLPRTGPGGADSVAVASLRL